MFDGKMYETEDDKKKSKQNNNVLKLLQIKYMKALKSNPLLTKAITSGIVSATGNVAAQWITIRNGQATTLDRSAIVRYAIFGSSVATPVMHFFYKWLDHNLPGKSRPAMAQRLLIERLIITPGLVACFHTLMALMEKKDVGAVKERLRLLYWATLVMNWKFWTVLQIININYVPRELKVIFGNLCGLVWTIFLATHNSKPKSD